MAAQSLKQKIIVIRRFLLEQTNRAKHKKVIRNFDQTPVLTAAEWGTRW